MCLCVLYAKTSSNDSSTLRSYVCLCACIDGISSNLSLRGNLSRKLTLHSAHACARAPHVPTIHARRRHPKHLINVCCFKMVKVLYKIIIRKCMFNYEAAGTHTHTHIAQCTFIQLTRTTRIHTAIIIIIISLGRPTVSSLHLQQIHKRTHSHKRTTTGVRR